jgi:hypothetical protein
MSSFIFASFRSYIEKEERKRADLGIDVASAPLGLTDNQQLAQQGHVFVITCTNENCFINSPCPLPTPFQL